jgi:hypothetical protein
VYLLFILNNLLLVFFHLTLLLQEKLFIVASRFHDLFDFLLVYATHTRLCYTIAECMKAVETGSITHRSGGLLQLLLLIVFNVLRPMVNSKLIPVIPFITVLI